MAEKTCSRRALLRWLNTFETVSGPEELITCHHIRIVLSLVHGFPELPEPSASLTENLELHHRAVRAYYRDILRLDLQSEVDFCDIDDSLEAIYQLTEEVAALAVLSQDKSVFVQKIMKLSEEDQTSFRLLLEPYLNLPKLATTYTIERLLENLQQLNVDKQVLQHELAEARRELEASKASGQQSGPSAFDSLLDRQSQFIEKLKQQLLAANCEKETLLLDLQKQTKSTERLQAELAFVREENKSLKARCQSEKKAWVLKSGQLERTAGRQAEELKEKETLISTLNCKVIQLKDRLLQREEGQMQQALELQRREVELKSLRKEIVDLREFRFKSMESLHEGERLTNDSMFNMDEEEDEVGLEEKNKALERHVEDLRGKVAELEQVVAHFETRRTEHVDEVKKGFSKLISGLKSRVKELDREKKELEENLIELRTQRGQENEILVSTIYELRYQLLALQPKKTPSRR